MSEDQKAPTIKVSLTNRIEATVLRRLLLVGTLVVLAMLGLFLTNISVDRARWYWSAMFPAFAVAGIWYELAQNGPQRPPLPKILFRQALHWLGPIIAVLIMFLQLRRGQMDADSVALVIILLLAVTSYLAGVNFESGFIWIGILLALVAVTGIEIEAYLWVIVVAMVIALVVVVTSASLLRRYKRNEAC
jgi:hypothetical protein